MTCNKDLIFNVLYLKNEKLLRQSVANSLLRLQCPWNNNKISLQTEQTLFFLLLHRDLELKKIIIDGLRSIGIDPMDAKKAENFFLAIENEVINPWLCNETITNEQFLDKIAALYWSC